MTSMSDETMASVDNKHVFRLRTQNLYEVASSVSISIVLPLFPSVCFVSWALFEGRGQRDANCRHRYRL